MDAEVTVAEMLRDALEDVTLWERLASPRDDEHDLLGGYAVDLFHSVWPAIGAITEDELSPLDFALGVLREIAAAAATQSHGWSDTEVAEFEVTLPTHDFRARVISALQTFEVDAWANGLGIPLLIDDQSPVENAIADLPNPPKLYEATLAGQVIENLNLFDGVLQTRHDPRIREMLSSGESRRGYAALVNVTRGMVRYATDHLPRIAQTALAAHTYVADALFVATRDLDGDLFPTRDYLRWLLDPDGREWLSAHGHTPRWLLPNAID